MMNKVNNKTKNKVFLKWLFGFNQSAWNYEKYQGLGYCSCMMPALKEIYKDDPEGLKNAVMTHLQFFNTSTHTGSAILGIDIAMEEQLGKDGLEAVSGIKTGLMGPLAGVGDTLFGVIIGAIFYSLAANFALNGSPLGIIIFIGVSIFVIIPIRYLFFKLGYKEGVSLVSSIGDKLSKITEAATILGLAVIGGLICQVVKVTLNLGEATDTYMGLLDSLMPCLLPALVTIIIYKLLDNKKLNSMKVIILVLIFSLVCGFFGILK